MRERGREREREREREGGRERGGREREERREREREREREDGEREREDERRGGEGKGEGESYKRGRKEVASHLCYLHVFPRHGEGDINNTSLSVSHISMIGWSPTRQTEERNCNHFISPKITVSTHTHVHIPLYLLDLP